MFKFIGDFLSGLWRFADRWRLPPFAFPGARIGNRLGGTLLFVFLLFCIIGLILVVAGSIFGLTPEQTLGGVDGWLAQIGPSLDFIGKILFQRVLMGLILLGCVAGAIALLFVHEKGAPVKWGRIILLLLLCLVLGYCSAVNLVAPLDPYNPNVGSQYYD